MVRVCYMKRLSEQFINSFTELKNNHVFRILIHSLWISHQKWYKSWSVALQRNVYGTRFNITLAYWHTAKCYVPCMTVNFPVTYFIFIFIRCVRTSVKTRNLVSRQFTYFIIIIFLISGHNHEIIMILFVASPCTLIKRGTN